MKVSDYIASFLYSQGVQHIFEVVGGMTTHLVDSVYRQGQIRLISTHHEQAAAFAAETIARITGIPGVAMATSGSCNAWTHSATSGIWNHGGKAVSLLGKRGRQT